MKFDLSQSVEIAVSGERGTVTGRAEYIGSQPAYYVRYKDADGKAQECWWTEDALRTVGSQP
jgi:hypothetical protein